MAISKIKKIRIIAYQPDKDRLVEYLQDKALIQVLSTKEFLNLDSIPISTSDLRENLDKIKEALEFLKSYSEDYADKVYLTREEFKSLIEEFDYSGLLKDIDQIRKEREDLNSKKIKIIQDYKKLVVWKDLDLLLECLLPTLYTQTLLGILPRRKFNDFLKETKSLKIYLKEIFKDKSHTHILITYLIEDKERLLFILKRFNFNTVSLDYKEGKISEILKDLQQELGKIDEKLFLLEDSFKKLALARPKLMAIYDYILNVKESLDIQARFRKTESTFLIEGWIRQKDIEGLKKDINLNFKDADLFISPPGPEDKIPVALENRRPFRPFEVITDLYGKPLYGWIDPTPFLAIFFSITLAFCLTDAGYGILLSLGSYIALKKFRLKQTARRFLQLFLICGLFTVVTGALVGSWFGNLFDKNIFVKVVKDRIMLFDPLKRPLNFLFLSLGLGFLQILFGIGLRFFKSLKNRLYFEAIFKEFPSGLLQISLLILIFIFFKILPSPIFLYAAGTLILGAVLIIVYQVRTQKELALKIFWSIYGLYGIIAGNFLADTLSFCRIFALGLTTSLLATAINEIYFFLPDLLKIILVPGFILAHIANLGINLLGAYVHTSRLQYLEFFTKFFEAQEESFKPFKREFEFVQLGKGG